MKTTVVLFALAMNLLCFRASASADEKRDLTVIQQLVNSVAPATLIEFNGSTDFSESQILCIQKDSIDWNNEFPDDWRIDEYQNHEVFFENAIAKSYCIFSANRTGSVGQVLSNIQLKLADNSVVNAEMSIYGEAASSASRIRSANSLALESRYLCKKKAMAKLQQLIQEKGFCQ